MRGDVPKQMRDDALRQIVCFDLVADRQLLHLRHKPPVAADHALEKALVPEVIEAPLVAVALTGRVNEGQVLGLAAGEQIGAGGQKQILQRHRDSLGKANADEAAGRDRVALPDQANRFRGGDDLALFAGAQRGQKRARSLIVHGTLRKQIRTAAATAVTLSGSNRTALALAFGSEPQTRPVA